MTVRENMAGMPIRWEWIGALLVRIISGAGAALNYALLRTSPSETTFFPGLSVIAGIRAFVTKRVAVFTEYKYNRATIEFSDQHVKAEYRTNYFMAGLSYHFQ